MSEQHVELLLQNRNCVSVVDVGLAKLGQDYSIDYLMGPVQRGCSHTPSNPKIRAVLIQNRCLCVQLLFLNVFLSQCGSQLHSLELTMLESSHTTAAGSLAFHLGQIQAVHIIRSLIQSSSKIIPACNCQLMPQVWWQLLQGQTCAFIVLVKLCEKLYSWWWQGWEQPQEAGCPLNPTAAESVRCLELSLAWKSSLDAYVSGMWAEAQIVFLTSELVLAGQTPA